MTAYNTLAIRQTPERRWHFKFGSYELHNNNSEKPITREVCEPTIITTSNPTDFTRQKGFFGFCCSIVLIIYILFIARYCLTASNYCTHRFSYLKSLKRTVSKVIAEVFHIGINICLRSRRILYFMFMQFFVFFSNMMQSILFMNEFFAAFLAFYNWVVMDASCMMD